jgi:hypothetical protein
MIHNISPGACDLDGYPQSVLVDARMAPLPFSYRQGGDVMLTRAYPRIVTLPAGGAAYLALNKNTCVAGERRMAAFISLTPPGEDQALTLRLGRYPILGYCGPGDPGHTIDLTPIEANFHRLLARQ